MNLKYKILAVLAAGIALTACGSSGTPAITPASRADQSVDMDTG